MFNSIQIKFNETKTVNTVLYIVSKLKRKDFHKIFKILYFSDREHLNKYGRTITGDKYIAMSDGPVPSNLYDIFKAVRGDGFYKDDGRFGQYFSVVDWDLIIPNKLPELSELSKTDIEIVDDTLSRYGNLSWDEVKEKSHDYAWKATSLNREIDFADIIREAGGNDDYIEYVKEQTILANL
ncbi:MAG: Panacea domain-containing protein [Candidatus Azobacteroides sp.]|nr:Panacea domain-containing protein [Candidatus Azobacteroides sp.]